MFLIYTYENTGSPVCLSQQFVFDQLSVAFLGFALSGYRRLPARMKMRLRFIHIVPLLVASCLSLYCIVWWLKYLIQYYL
jgi:hypothetical protein